MTGAVPPVAIEGAKEILVVDDDEDVAGTLAVLLQLDGYNVRHSTSSAEAIHLLEDNLVHLVITDFSMPGMDGAEMLRVMCEKFDMKSVAVVVVSASDEDLVREKCPTMSAFLLKPFQPDELLRVVRQLLA